MLGPWRCIAALLLAAGLMVLGSWGAQAETEVDLALVLAVDVSLSMEPDEQELQRQGFVEAFRSPEVHEAIGKGMLGRIAVVYVEWAGAGYQQVVVPWTVIEQPGDSRLCGPPGRELHPALRLHLHLGRHRLQPLAAADSGVQRRPAGDRHLR